MKLHIVIWRIVTMVRYKFLFNSIGNHTTICHPLQMDHVSSISIGNNVFIADGAWLFGSEFKNNTLTICNGTNIGHFSHIVAQYDVFIDKNVLIADKVFITDVSHTYDNFTVPVLKQPVKYIGNVYIGEGSWIGENVCICGASIGKHCVIGANSVVTHDIPDFSVAVGCPAEVVKKYDFESNKWSRVRDSSPPNIH